MIKKIIAILLMCVFLGNPTIAVAGDIVAAGTTLESDSYVFTIEEATNLLQRIEELEVKEQELEQYTALDSIRTQQIDLYKINLDYTRSQLTYYIEIESLNQDLISRYNKRSRFHTLENIGFMTLGIGLTIGAFLAADSITDHMETNNAAAVSF